MKVVAEKLAAYMETKRGSSKTIAEKCGVTATTVSEWKSGRRPVPAKYLPIICEVLEVPETDLCQNFSPFEHDWMRSPAGQTLLQICSDLTPAQLERVLLQALQVKQSETIN